MAKLDPTLKQDQNWKPNLPKVPVPPPGKGPVLPPTPPTPPVPPQRYIGWQGGGWPEPWQGGMTYETLPESGPFYIGTVGALGQAGARASADLLNKVGLGRLGDAATKWLRTASQTVLRSQWGQAAFPGQNQPNFGLPSWGGQSNGTNAATTVHAQGTNYAPAAIGGHWATNPDGTTKWVGDTKTVGGQEITGRPQVTGGRGFMVPWVYNGVRGTLDTLTNQFIVNGVPFNPPQTGSGGNYAGYRWGRPGSARAGGISNGLVNWRIGP